MNLLMNLSNNSVLQYDITVGNRENFRAQETKRLIADSFQAAVSRRHRLSVALQEVVLVRQGPSHSDQRQLIP